MIVIVVLGRKLNSDGSPSDILLSRMEDAVTWYNWFSGFGETMLLLSGGLGAPGYADYFKFSKTTEASVMKRIAVKLGVPPEQIVLEESSKNTIENAEFTLDILNDYNYDELYLLTSDFHMKRALSIFNDIVDENIFTLVSKYDPFFEKAKEIKELEKYLNSK